MLSQLFLCSGIDRHLPNPSREFPCSSKAKSLVNGSLMTDLITSFSKHIEVNEEKHVFLRVKILRKLHKRTLGIFSPLKTVSFQIILLFHLQEILFIQNNDFYLQSLYRQEIYEGLHQTNFNHQCSKNLEFRL